MYVAKVKIGDVKAGGSIGVKAIGKDNVKAYLAKGYIIASKGGEDNEEAKKAEEAK